MPGWSASEKRQGTKSRELGTVGAAGRLSGFSREVRSTRLDQSARSNCFASQDGCG
jgi:hypothetical protein